MHFSGAICESYLLFAICYFLDLDFEKLGQSTNEKTSLPWDLGRGQLLDCGAVHAPWLLVQIRNPELNLGFNYRLLDYSNHILFIHLFYLFI